MTSSTTTPTSYRGGGGGGVSSFRGCVTKLRPNDVVLIMSRRVDGDGSASALISTDKDNSNRSIENEGNVRFMTLVRNRCLDCQLESGSREEHAIATQIIGTIHFRRGLFLQKIDLPKQQEDLRLGVHVDTAAAWIVADFETVFDAVRQALFSSHQAPSSSRKRLSGEAGQAENGNVAQESSSSLPRASWSLYPSPSSTSQQPLAKRQRILLDDTMAPCPWIQPPPPPQARFFAAVQGPSKRATMMLTTMSEPASLSAAVFMNRFQGVVAPEQVEQLQLPFQAARMLQT